MSREECIPAIEEYYRLNREIPAEAFACGRITMEESFTGGWYPDLTEFENVKIDREDYIANQDAKRYAVAFDRKGRLGWKKAEIEDEDPGYDGVHIIEVLCEDVQDAYLAYLQSIRVSYIFAGKEKMDLEMASDMGTYYYDLDEEEIVYLSEDSGFWNDEDKELAELMDMDWERFIELPSQREIHEYEMMEDYIEEIQDDKLQSELYREFVLHWCKKNNIRCEIDV